MNQRVQPGLVDRHLDFFLSNNRLFFSYNGQIKPFNELPEDKLNDLENHLLQDDEAVASLDALGLTNRMERLRMFATCRFGGNDIYPDMSEDGNFRADFHLCPLSGSCPHEGKLCKILSGPSGQEISPREKEVLLLVADGYMRKQIAEMLSIEMVTVAKTITSLFEKTHTASAVQLVVWAMKQNFNQPQYDS